MAERKYRAEVHEPQVRAGKSRPADRPTRLELQGTPLPGDDCDAGGSALETTFMVLERLFELVTKGLVAPIGDEIKTVIRALHLDLQCGPYFELHIGRSPEEIIRATLEATAELAGSGRKVTLELAGVSVSVQVDAGAAVDAGDMAVPEAARPASAVSGIVLPLAPDVVRQVLSLAADPDAGITQAVRLIKRDPVLAGRVIQYVNSARFGLSRRITDLGSAATIIGYANLRALALGCAFRDAWSGRCAGFDYEDFWRRSTATGAAAHQLAESMGTVPPEDALTMGLLADIGRLALATSDPGRYALVLEEAGTSTTELLLRAEDRHFGYTHHDATLYLLLEWKLPQDYALAAFHQDEESPPPLPKDAAAMQQILHYAIHMSAVFTWPRQRPSRHVLAHVERHAVTAVGTDRRAAGVFNHAIAEWYDIGEMLDVRTSPVRPWPSTTAG